MALSGARPISDPARTERLRWCLLRPSWWCTKGGAGCASARAMGSKDLFTGLMARLRSIKQHGGTYTSSRAAPLTEGSSADRGLFLTAWFFEDVHRRTAAANATGTGRGVRLSPRIYL